MRPIILLLFAWFVLGLGVVLAVPARRPYYEPPPPPTPTPVVAIGGQTWHGKLFLENSTIKFRHDGTLTYNDTSPGTWRLVGDKLHFDINQYSEYDVTVSGDEMRGTGSNKAGMRCTPHLKRVFDPK